MENMQITKYLAENMLPLVPFLYVVGMILKDTEKIKDKYIPLILLPIGVLFSLLITGLSPDGVIQGVLATGITVYGNQVIKQLLDK